MQERKKPGRALCGNLRAKERVSCIWPVASIGQYSRLRETFPSVSSLGSSIPLPSQRRIPLLASLAPRLRTPPPCDAGAIPLGERSLGRRCSGRSDGRSAGVPAAQRQRGGRDVWALSPAASWPSATWPRSRDHSGQEHHRDPERDYTLVSTAHHRDSPGVTDDSRRRRSPLQHQVGAGPTGFCAARPPAGPSRPPCVWCAGPGGPWSSNMAARPSPAGAGPRWPRLRSALVGRVGGASGRSCLRTPQCVPLRGVV